MIDNRIPIKTALFFMVHFFPFNSIEFLTSTKCVLLGEEPNTSSKLGIMLTHTADLVSTSFNCDRIEFPNIMKARPNTIGKVNNTAPMIKSNDPTRGSVRDRSNATPKRMYPKIVSMTITIMDSLKKEGWSIAKKVEARLTLSSIAK